MRLLKLLPVLLVMVSFTVGGQTLPKSDTYYKNNPEWRKMMHKKNANINQVRKAFNLYMKDKKFAKGTGWKVFERWAYHQQFFSDGNGNILSPGKLYQTYTEFADRTKGIQPMGEWSQIGPKNLPSSIYGRPSGMGRVNAIAFHPSDENVIYVGSPSGGLWKTTTGGSSWMSTTDNLPSIGVSSIIVSKDNPNEVFIGTGDRDASDAIGLGVFKSEDGGHSWKQMNNGMGNVVVNRMDQNSINPNTIVAATSGGIFISNDKGNNWTKSDGASGAFWDLKYKPGDTTTIYAANLGSFYRSINGGESFSKISLPLTSSRTSIAVTPANPNVVYLTLASGDSFKALIKSTNSGESFVVQSESPNILGYSPSGSDDKGQAWYDLCSAVSPVDENVIFVGGVNIWKSINGGKTWSLSGYWIDDVHADQHEMKFSTLNNNLYVGNDGGFYKVTNNGSTYTDLGNGLEISQIYKIGVSAKTKDLVIAGFQDNGTSTYTSSGWLGSIGGDGMECIIDHTNDNYRYGELYYGNIRRSKSGNGGFIGVAPDECYDASAGQYTGLWVTPYCLNEIDPNYMYAGYSKLWRASNINTASTGTYVNWVNITPSLTIYSKIKVIEASPANENILYFSNETKKLFVSTNVNDANPTWTNLTGFYGSTINDIEAHPTKDSTVYVCLNNRIYKSDDLGQSWINLTDNLPNLNYTSIVYDKYSDDGIYVGTNMGVFYRSNNTNGWIYFSKNFPVSVAVTELEIYYDTLNPENSRLRAATYGRGLWESPLYRNTHTNDILVSSINIPTNATAGDSYTPQIRVKNMGSNVVSSFVVNYKLNNGTLQEKTVTKTLNQFEEDTVSFDAITLSSSGNNMIVSNVSYSDASTDDNVANNTFKANFSVSGTGVPTINFAATPMNQNVNTAVSFEATVDGSADSYEWNFGEGATPATATGIGPHEVTYTTGGKKDISLTVYSGSQSVVETKYSYVTIYNTPVIVEQPQDVNICQDEIFTLQVVADGDDLTYQWKKDGQEIGGATQKFYSVGNPKPENSGAYSCIITNPAGNIESNTATVVIKAKPTVGISVDNETLCSGETATITVTGGAEYAWSDGLGSNNSVSVAPTQTHSYFVTVTDNGCSTISEIPITVPTGIIIDANTTVDGCEGNIASISVNAIGEALTYQWYKNSDIIEGAIDYTYSIPSLSEADLANYTCQVSNKCFSETSPVITINLQKQPIADFSFSISDRKVTFINNSLYADSYLWQFTDGTQSTEENPVHTFPSNNSYLARLTATGTCGVNLVSKTINLTGINDVVNNEISLHPNPNNGNFDIEINNELVGENQISIVDISGRVIYENRVNLKLGTYNFNNLNLQKGLYLLKLKNSRKVYVNQFIVN